MNLLEATAAVAGVAFVWRCTEVRADLICSAHSRLAIEALL